MRALCLERSLPTVLVNRADVLERMSAATPDDRQGMRLAVRHLISLGHRSIGHLAGPQNVSTGRLRLAGFEEEMRNAGLPPGPVVIAEGYTREAGQVSANRLLEMSPGLSAIAAANDLLALGVYRELASRGMACPAQISVTGHNDMALVDIVQPPLTTVRIPHDQIGREGARLLLERIENPGSPLVQVRTTPELIVRKSTGPFPSTVD